MSFLKKMDKKKKSEDKVPTVTIHSLLNDDEETVDLSSNGNRILELDTNQVKPNPQVRTEFDDESIFDIAESMKSRGQQLPITVSGPDNDGKYIIQDGECRWRAAKLADMKIQAVVRNPFESDQDRIFDQLVSNIQRDDLRPLDISKSISALKSMGISSGEIAKQLGKTPTYISRHGKLMDLPEPVLKLCRDRIVNDVITLNNLGNLYALNSDRAEAVCKSVLEDGITRKQSDRYLREEKDKSKKIQDPSEQKGDKFIQSSTEDDFDDLNIDDPIEVDGELKLDTESGESFFANSAVSDEQELPESDQDISLGMQKQQKKISSSKPNKPTLEPRCREVKDVGISVQVEGSKEPCVLCLDRIDDDADFVWVKFEKDLSRVHKDTVKILSIFEK